MATPICITDTTDTQLQELLTSLGEPPFRARQLQHWIYRGLAVSFDEMTDIPQSLRSKLAKETCLHSLTPSYEAAAGDGTLKTLFSLRDGKTIESTLMPYPTAAGKSRNTICLSTQVGCPVGCPFCATGQQGYERNLTAGEIIDQALYYARRLRDGISVPGNSSEKTMGHITNLVFMGMGEPLANYDALMQAIERLNSPLGFGLRARSMVISTAGLVPGIQRLSQEKSQLGLAISLHAADNTLRDLLVPLNKSYPLEQLIPACREYIESTGRRPTFEYTLFDGINDSLEHARSLARLLSKINCHVNLIQANITRNGRFRPSAKSAVLAFEDLLKERHIPCTLRQRRGLDIDAGCGQLRSRFL
ncbi:MAG: 23S rRNA (adenine(2503)-C(2))-methyltransferase RlmN [Dehalococcoidia bacterium]|nr:23S rRNA (adenine(2503)-C(2))-methyltransferase RlmN [Dehalococcoidia bacterium]